MHLRIKAYTTRKTLLRHRSCLAHYT